MANYKDKSIVSDNLDTIKRFIKDSDLELQLPQFFENNNLEKTNDFSDKNLKYQMLPHCRFETQENIVYHPTEGAEKADEYAEEDVEEASNISLELSKQLCNSRLSMRLKSKRSSLSRRGVVKILNTQALGADQQ